jgi:hypothetical protein
MAPGEQKIFEPQSAYLVWSTTAYVPSSELGLPTPSLASECAPPLPEPKGVGKGLAYSPAGEGGGDPNSDDRRKGLALCLLFDLNCVRRNHLNYLGQKCTKYI